MSLVTPGEGREDTRARITLPATRRCWRWSRPSPGREARLIVTGDAAGSRSAEVSHEALIRHWDKLRAWVDENRDNLLAAAERQLGLCDRLAALIADPRDPSRVVHPLADILRARILAIACGYEDADDLDHLRRDPAFKLACGRLPDTGGTCARSRPSRAGRTRRPCAR